MLHACNNQPAENTETDTKSSDSAVAEEPLDQGPQLTLAWETDTVLTTSESVLFDKDANIMYVSNISGNPTDKDGVGFISKMDRDGVVTEKEWAKGLDAPKGMGIMDGKLYVTNIDELVVIDMKDGKVVKRYPVKGAKFLNDVAIGKGKVYFSDMETGKLHVFQNDEVSTWRDGHERLNGLAFRDGSLYLLDGKGLHKIEREGAEPQTLNSNVTGGDGLVVINEHTFIVSRWDGEIWIVEGRQATKLLDSKADEIQTADIGYIPEENLVLVPRFFSNKVSAYKLDGI